MPSAGCVAMAREDDYADGRHICRHLQVSHSMVNNNKHE